LPILASNKAWTKIFLAVGAVADNCYYQKTTAAIILGFVYILIKVFVILLLKAKAF